LVEVEVWNLSGKEGNFILVWWWQAH
jgi:hypothetical protein